MNYLRYICDYIRFKRKVASPRFELSWKERLPCLGDDTSQTDFDHHYVYHLAWAARVLTEGGRPESHVDISSSLYFCSMVSAFLPVRFFDYRPADLRLDNLQCGSAELLSLPFADGSIMSLSCMHVLEHVGLGRYGDVLQPEGDEKAIAELKRVLGVGGNLLVVVPIGGRPRIVFNAHRIYSYAQIAGYFSDLELVEFALIPDGGKDGGLVRNASPASADRQGYGCGCFWFRRSE